MSQSRDLSGQSSEQATPSARTKLGNTLASLLTKTAQRLSSGQDQSATTNQPFGSRQGTQTIGSGPRQQNRTSPWSLPVSQRPALPFDQGGIAQVLNCLPQLRTDSPGAAVALVHYVTMHRAHTDPLTERDREKARNEFSRLLTQICPNSASLDSAQAGREEMQRSAAAQGHLTAELTYWEQNFLMLAHSMATDHSIEEVAAGLSQTADGLRDADSQRRQASARIMLADILLQLRKFGHADREIATALALIGAVYPNEELIKLARTVDSTTVEQVIGRQSTTTVRSHQPQSQPQTTTTLKSPRV